MRAYRVSPVEDTGGYSWTFSDDLGESGTYVNISPTPEGYVVDATTFSDWGDDYDQTGMSAKTEKDFDDIQQAISYAEKLGKLAEKRSPKFGTRGPSALSKKALKNPKKALRALSKLKPSGDPNL